MSINGRRQKRMNNTNREGWNIQGTSSIKEKRRNNTAWGDGTL